MRSGYWRWLASAIMLWALGTSAQTNGIFADFTTSMGNFTCQLSYSNSPAAVANFIGLATGERPWLDLVTGEARTNAFYEGLTFHRVIAGFMIQGGSPNGLGTDGPGYAFVDEFNTNLNFNGPWVMAMANSGPDSNGSQFFVTVAPYTSGNNSYEIFGRVVSGTNIVYAINHVATNPTNDAPLTKVVIQHVGIRRVGTAAQNFDINAYGLPVVTNIPVALQPGAQQLSLVFSNRLYADNRWYSTTNLKAWTANEFGIEITAPNSNSIVVPMDSAEKFFRLAQVEYSGSTRAPRNVLGKTLVLAFSSNQTNTLVFNATGGGTYNFPGIGSGTLTSYTWSQDPYRAFLWPVEYSGSLGPMTIQLNFKSAGGGSLTGTYYGLVQSSLSGTFTLKP